MEYALPIIDGLEASELIRQFLPQVLILIVTLHRHKELFSVAKIIGVKGYVHKMNAASTLLPAIDAILQGGTCFPT